jgi:hypothetical protein
MGRLLLRWWNFSVILRWNKDTEKKFGFQGFFDSFVV